MYIIEMVDDWDRTIKIWIVNCSEDEVINFVNTMNSVLANKLSEEVESNRECYFYYRKEEVVDLPTEEEIKELLRPSDFELSMREPVSNTIITDETLLNWDTAKFTDMSGLFKDCK